MNGTDTEEQRAAADSSFPEWQKYLEIKNVTIDNRTITRINRLQDASDHPADPSLPTAPEYDLFSLDFSEGESVERAAFFTSFPDEQKSDVGAKMGVTLYGGRLAADESKGLVTNIPGVYAIGDANSDNVTNVPHALFTGKRTAVYLHGKFPPCSCMAIPQIILTKDAVQLAREEAQRELAANATVTRREKDLDLRAIWDEMNPRGILYAGEFEQ